MPPPRLAVVKAAVHLALTFDAGAVPAGLVHGLLFDLGGLRLHTGQLRLSAGGRCLLRRAAAAAAVRRVRLILTSAGGAAGAGGGPATAGGVGVGCGGGGCDWTGVESRRRLSNAEFS